MMKIQMFYKGLEQKFLNTTQFLKSVTSQIVDQLQTTTVTQKLLTINL